MASPTSVLSKTLQSITLTKIKELESRRNSYEARKRDFLDKANAAADQRDRLAYLLDAFKELYPGAAKDRSLANIERWLVQSRYDASIPVSKLASFDEQLRSKLDIQSRKLDMAHLYSRLLTGALPGQDSWFNTLANTVLQNGWTNPSPTRSRTCRPKTTMMPLRSLLNVSVSG
jgi:hypothetical protein